MRGFTRTWRGAALVALCMAVLGLGIVSAGPPRLGVLEPKVTITAEPETITAGDSATLTWTSRRAATVEIDQGVGAVAASGSVKVTPRMTTTYTITATGRRTSATDSVTVTVTDPPTPPPPPPPPPPPGKKIRVLLTGPGPREIREGLTIQQVPILTSVDVRKLAETVCEALPDGSVAFRILPLDYKAQDPLWNEMVSRAPRKRFSLVMTKEGKESVGDLPSDTPATLKAIADFAGTDAPKIVPFTPPCRALTPLEARRWTPNRRGQVLVNGKVRVMATKPRDLAKHPYGSQGATLAELGINLIPRSEWKARIDALTAANAGLFRLGYAYAQCSDQGPTSSCWGNAVSNAVGLLRLEEGEKWYPLSAASLTGPVTDYRDEGGWPRDAVEYAQKHGIVRTSLWPNTAVTSQSYFFSKEVQADYPKHKVVSVMLDLGNTGKMFDEVMTVVLLGGTGADSFNPIGHAMAQAGAGYDSQGYFLYTMNSWGEDWGDKGWFKAYEGHGAWQGTPDDSQGVLFATAANVSALRPMVSVEVPVKGEVVPASRDPLCPNGTCPNVPGTFPRTRLLPWRR